MPRTASPISNPKPNPKRVSSLVSLTKQLARKQLSWQTRTPEAQVDVRSAVAAIHDRLSVSMRLQAWRVHEMTRTDRQIKASNRRNLLAGCTGTCRRIASSFMKPKTAC